MAFQSALPVKIGPYTAQVIDLTHPLQANISRWPGDPAYTLEPVAHLPTAGYRLNYLHIGEHTGTHVGVPAHLLENGATLEQLPPVALVRPGVVLDVVRAAAANPDFALTPTEIIEWEQRNGPIPPAAIVILRTGWEQYWGSGAYLGLDEQGLCHFPGFGPAAAEYLLQVRQVAGLGIDTHGVDVGNDAMFLCNMLLAQHGGIHLENLCNLGALSSQGFVLFIGALPLVGGTGSPARVLALRLNQHD